MATIIDPPNSVWPNGLKVDSEGYVTFYPMGTNKVDITTITWPDGDKLVSPFVYKDDKLVGFVDTKALTVSGNASTTMNYSHIEADFSSISEGTLTVDAPNAAVKEFKWAVAEISFKYKGCKTVDDIKAIDADYLTTDIVDGIWVENLADLENGATMFIICSNLAAFSSNLSSLTEGDRMFFGCENLTSFNSDLSSLINGGGMFYACSNLAAFSSDLPNLTYGESMFSYCSSITAFPSNLSSLTNGKSMFFSCSNLTTFSSDLSSLTNGESMFSSCGNLTTFNFNLSSLTNGMNMFNYCSSLTAFSSDLPNLTDGQSMFNGTKLASFDIDLPKLTKGENMFDSTKLSSFSSDLSSLTEGDRMFYNCKNLTSFSSDLSSLTDGYGMFNGCSNLTAFSSDLPSLTNANSMFYGCKLDAVSVKNIIDTINTVSGVQLSLGMGCNNTAEDTDLFAQEVGYADMTSLLAAFTAKGWNVYAQSTGRPTSTYSLRRPSEGTLPVFVKLEEEEKHADYTSMDGIKKFRLNWFHKTTSSTEGYTQFASLEEAVEHFNIKPIERN